MASNDNQGYLIGIIVLVLLVVGLGLATYLGFSGSSENANARAEAESRLKDARDRADALDFEVKILRSTIGFESGVSQIDQMLQSIERANSNTNNKLDDIKDRATDSVKKYREDAAKILNPTTGQDVTYKLIVDSFKSGMAEKHDRVSAIEEQLNRKKQEAAENEAAHKKEIEAKDASITTYQTDIKEEKERNQGEEAKLNTEIGNLTQKFDAKVTELQNSQQAHDKDNKENTDKIARLDKDNAKLKNQIAELTRVNSDIADGKIIRVSPAANRVFINLGYADGLKPKQRFNVYDRLNSKYEKYLEKATVEVLRVSDKHMSEAQVVELAPTSDIMNAINSDVDAGLLTKEEARTLTVQLLRNRGQADPILSGDHILSEVWDPGFSLSIALVGLIDLNGDGRSDLARFESIVERNGGKVVCKHDAQGNKTGDIDIETRFIVIGDPPEDPAALKTYTAILEEAEQFKIQKISMKKMLNTLGIQAEASVQNLDRNIGREGFQRKAPSRGGSSAYDNN